MVERVWIGVAIISLLLGVSFMVLQPMEERPNVVFVTVDALNPDHLGAYGYSRNTSPNIDRFASNSTVFTNTSSPATITSLAMPSVFTSRYPVTDKVVAMDGTSWKTNLSFVRDFQKSGYRTSAVVAHTYVKSEFGFDAYFDDFDDDFRQGSERSFKLRNSSLKSVQKRNILLKKRSAEETTELAVDSLNQEKPFFLWLHYVDPHTPYGPLNTTYIEYFREECVDEGEEKTYKWQNTEKRNLTRCDMQFLNARYDAEVRYFDRYFGRLLGELKTRDLYENTIIVLTADHGECLGENGVVGHVGLYGCALQVPLIVHVPDKEPRKIDQPVSTIDIFPTLLDLLDIEVDRFTRGQNLFSDNPRSYQFSENARKQVLNRYGANVTLNAIERILRERGPCQD